MELLLLLVIPLLFFLIRKHRKNGLILPPPPGPSGLPFIGNLHQLDTSALHHHLWLLSKKYGPLMTLKLGFVPTLVVSSAKMAKEVLKTNDLEFSSRPNFLSQQRLSYNGFDLTFAPYGDYWREMRKICVLHLFGPNRVQSFSSIREEEVSRMIKTISNSASDSITNLSELLLSLTSSIICRIAFGKRYGDHEIESCGRSKYHSLLNEVQAVAGSFCFSDYFPYLGCWIDKLTGQYRRIDKTCKELDLFLQEIIDEHLDERRAKDDQEDITDILLQLQTDRSFTIDLTLEIGRAHV